MEDHNSSRITQDRPSSRPESATRDAEPGVRVLNLGGVAPNERRINLRDLGFVYRVSDEALAEIEANRRRAFRVIQTADRFWFQ